MSNEVKQAYTGDVYVRKATFTVEKVKNSRVFRPVNRRALKLTRKVVGRRTKLSLEDMRAIKAQADKSVRTKYKLYQWEQGTLKTVRV